MCSLTETIHTFSRKHPCQYLNPENDFGILQFGNPTHLKSRIELDIAGILMPRKIFINDDDGKIYKSSY